MPKERTFFKKISSTPKPDEIFHSMMDNSATPALARVKLEELSQIVEIKVSEMKNTSSGLYFKGTAVNITNIIGDEIINVEVSAYLKYNTVSNQLTFHILED